jgi:cell wall-associated NlpC family hydrolase
MMKLFIIGTMAMALLLGCQGRPRYGGGYHDAEGQAKTKEATKHEVTASAYAVDPIAMGKIIDGYLGKPYAGQGKNQKGYDCSEFVGAIYQEYASMHIPRTTENLFKTGRVVESGDLFFGDLVFFDTGGRGVSHVGIYVGYGEFVHSSSSNGIIISSLSDKYYKKRYLGARRVME